MHPAGTSENPPFLRRQKLLTLVLQWLSMIIFVNYIFIYSLKKMFIKVNHVLFFNEVRRFELDLI